MSVKQFVNTKSQYDSFKEYIEEVCLDVAYCQLKQESDPMNIYRKQGEIKAYERMLKLREEINGST